MEEQEITTNIVEETTETSQLIPPNPRSLEISEMTSRFSGATWFKSVKDKDVAVLGCGGIGSWVAVLLARTGVGTIILIDPDTVEESNMSGQFFAIPDIGQAKVLSVFREIKRFAPEPLVFSYQERVTEGTIISQDIVFCGFDNMEARQIAFSRWRQAIGDLDPTQRSKFLFIDGRLAAEEFQVFAIRGDDKRNIKRYREQFLFEDSEAEPTQCSYKQTSYVANMIASVMVGIFVNFCANEQDLPIKREVPFLTTYNSLYMRFKFER